MPGHSHVNVALIVAPVILYGISTLGCDTHSSVDADWMLFQMLYMKTQVWCVALAVLSNTAGAMHPGSPSE